MDPQTRQRIADLTGTRILAVSPLSGGCIAPVYRLDLADGRSLVAKFGDDLHIEAWMLNYLAVHAGLPMPHPIHAETTLLLMEYIPAGATLNQDAQTHAADLLARLHTVTAPTYGCERDTLIGGLPQPNLSSTLWLPFFIDQRLLHMAELAHQAGHLPTALRHRIDVLAGRLDHWLDEPERPGLVHGDMWHGNILCHQTIQGHRVAGFIDPAIYYADPEMELAYATLFDTLGSSFFDRYQAHRPISPGFIEVKRDLYNLYPLLVHVALFDGHYLSAVERILGRFGC